MSLSRQRWQILGKALREKNVSNEPSAASVRSFRGFSLFMVDELSDSEDVEGVWYTYGNDYLSEMKIYVRHLRSTITVKDLIGFNNTGNTCVWPSEEVLAHYCIKHAALFNNKFVCELGGGMTCLAGVMLWTAVSSRAQMVLLSDGNEKSVQNIQAVVDKNRLNFGSTRVDTRCLKWDELNGYSEDLGELFDFILCADCLFFRDMMNHLLDLMYFLLKPNAVAIIMAPSRGGTLDHFEQLAKAKFSVERIDQYDDAVTQKHTENKEKLLQGYCEDLHYPRMLFLCKAFHKQQKNV